MIASPSPVDQIVRIARIHGRCPALSLSILIAVLASAAMGAEPALAHAHYAHSQPAIGQVLSVAPTEIDIYTDSDMRKLPGGNEISVSGPGGSQVDDGNTVVDDANRQHFSIGLKPNLSPGRYVVTFKTLSDVDGDTDGGHFAFYIGAGPTAAQKAQDAALNGPPVAVAAATPTASSASSPWSPLKIAIAVAIFILILVIGAGFVVRRKQQGRPHQAGTPEDFSIK